MPDGHLTYRLTRLRRDFLNYQPATYSSLRFLIANAYSVVNLRFVDFKIGGQLFESKSNLPYTRGITPKRVTSGGIHLCGLAPGQHSSEETLLRCWLASGKHISEWLHRKFPLFSPAI